MATSYKPVGGVESCTLYPADAVESAIFSVEGCKVELATSSSEVVDVELVDDASLYEEEVVVDCGIVKVAHRLTLVAHRNSAAPWLDADFLNRAASEGVIAIIRLVDGRELIAGYSQRFADEQPLLLNGMVVTSKRRIADTPTATLQLVSFDTDFSMSRVY